MGACVDRAPRDHDAPHSVNALCRVPARSSAVSLNAARNGRRVKYFFTLRCASRAHSAEHGTTCAERRGAARRARGRSPKTPGSPALSATRAAHRCTTCRARAHRTPRHAPLHSRPFEGRAGRLEAHIPLHSVAPAPIVSLTGHRAPVPRFQTGVLSHGEAQEGPQEGDEEGHQEGTSSQVVRPSQDDIRLRRWAPLRGRPSVFMGRPALERRQGQFAQRGDGGQRPGAQAGVGILALRHDRDG